MIFIFYIYPICFLYSILTYQFPLSHQPMNVFRNNNANIDSVRSVSQESHQSRGQHQTQPYKGYHHRGIINFNHPLDHRKSPTPQNMLHRNSSISDRSGPSFCNDNKENILRKLSMIENVSDINMNHNIKQTQCHQRRQSSNLPNNFNSNNERNMEDHYSLQRSPSQLSYSVPNEFQTPKKYIDPKENIEDKLEMVIGRLERAQKQISKLSKKNGNKSPQKDHELSEIKEIYTMFLNNKKTQAKINDDNYQEIQNIKKSLQSVTLKVETLPFKMQASIIDTNSLHHSIQALKSEYSEKIKNISELLQQYQKQLAFHSYFKIKEKLHLRQSQHMHENKKAPIEQCTQIRAEQSFIDRLGNRIHFNQIIYYVDQYGSLLDANRFYIVDQNNNSIKLTQKQIALIGRRSKGLR